jgi:hypothetical protein
MIPNNDPQYKTKDSTIQRFTPFISNIKKETEDLKKALRQNRDDKTSRQSFPHSGQDEMFWNTVTNKMDKNLTKAQIEDRIKSLEEDGDKKEKDHKYKIVDEKKVIKSFENFVSLKNENCGCGCDDCQCGSNVEKVNSPLDKIVVGEQGLEVHHDSDTEETSYMFFNNLETIHRMCTSMMELDRSKVNSMLNDGHNWAEDHMSVAKENISHVHNFLINKGVSENMETEMESHNENYMFFANIETICRMVSEMLEFNNMEVDTLLGEGHDWAEDHISSAKENVHQVFDWLENEMQ